MLVSLRISAGFARGVWGASVLTVDDAQRLGAIFVLATNGFAADLPVRHACGSWYAEAVVTALGQQISGPCMTSDSRGARGVNPGIPWVMCRRYATHHPTESYFARPPDLRGAAPPLFRTVVRILS